MFARCLAFGVLLFALPVLAGQPAVPGQSEPSTWVLSVAFSPDGKLLAAGLGDPKARGGVCVWETTSRKVKYDLREPAGVPSVAFMDSGTLAVVSLDQPVRLLDAQTGQVRTRFENQAKSPRWVVYSDRLAASFDQAIRLWDPSTGKETKTLTGNADQILGLAFAPDGKSLATASRDQTVRLWDVATGASQVLGKQESRISSVIFSPDGQWVLTAGNEICVWDAGKRELRHRLEILGAGSAMAFSPAARTLAVGNYSQGGIQLVDMNLNEPTASEHERIRDLLAKLDDDSYDVRETATKDLRELNFLAEPELRRLMKESPSAEVRIRARRLREEILTKPRAVLKGHIDRVESIAFSPDGKLLASGSRDGTVRLWDITSRKEPAVLVPGKTPP